ncbi:MAG: GNAT family N-acetyltransferase [Acidobacteria bacterium]|nr:GNAT family N-acetyltransferase [Acidobacteriota bacterium]
MSYTFREAESQADLDGIRRLNHLIFAEEIGQYGVAADGRLVDKHEARSRFFIALCDGGVVGMVCACAVPPYSIESRLADPRLLDDLPHPLVEVRLLAVHPEHRNRLVFLGVLGSLTAWAVDCGFGAMLISGVTERLEMYTRMGFRPLGPPVAGGKAMFTPMALRLSEMPERIRTDLKRYLRRVS